MNQFKIEVTSFIWTISEADISSFNYGTYRSTRRLTVHYYNLRIYFTNIGYTIIAWLSHEIIFWFCVNVTDT